MEGLLTATFSAYELREHPDEVVREREYQPRLGQASRAIASDFGKADRVRAGVVRRAGSRTFTAIMRAASCEGYDTGTVVYCFIRLVVERVPDERKVPVLEDMANPAVAALVRLEKHALNESERMRQFVRFSHLENGVWYARCSPNANVVPFVMGYFSARLNDQPFIIYDERHHVAGVYDGFKWGLVAGDAVNVPAADADDALMQEAWKRFYDAACIDARYNPELQRRFMPARLWRDLPEMQPR